MTVLLDAAGAASLAAAGWRRWSRLVTSLASSPSLMTSPRSEGRSRQMDLRP